MDYFVIDGPQKLSGQVDISGSKNAVLPILVASLMCDKVVLRKVPHLKDVTTLLALLYDLGVTCNLLDDMSLNMDTTRVHSFEAKYELVRQMRASFWVIAPLLTRFKYAKVSLPGGCKIGARPVDMYLAALREMGAEIKIEAGYVIARAPKGLKGATIDLRIPSVGVTHTVIMAAVLADGQTHIHGAAREPEVTDLIDFLNKAGAKISGRGTSQITIEGVRSLGAVSHEVIPDRIEAATYLIGAAMTRGDVCVNHCDPSHLKAIIEVLKTTGAAITQTDSTVSLNMHGKKPKAVSLDTGYYPDFPTDLQAPIVAMNTVADGEATVKEFLFENRFMHIPELMRLGAQINMDHHTVTMRGVSGLVGTQVQATDLRAAVALVLAGACASGRTLISRIHHIDRGYVHIDEKLSRCGIDIFRTDKISEFIG